MEKIDNETIDTITKVLHFLENHKGQAVDRLFGDVSVDYKYEWTKRSSFMFWTHLDTQNARRLIEFALEEYSE